MRNLLFVFAFGFAGCASLRADFKAALNDVKPELAQCADKAALDAAAQFLPAVTALLNGAPASLKDQLRALESAGKSGLLCAVDAVAEGAEDQLQAPVTSVQIAPMARVRAIHYLAGRAQ